MSIAVAETTIETAVMAYLKYKKGKIGLPADHGIKRNSYNTLKNHLITVVSRLDISQPISLNKLAIEHLVDIWLRMAADGEVSYRTATAYLLTFKSFLNWCDYNDEIPYTHPHAIDRLFKFRNTNKPKIMDYNPALLRQVLAALDDKTQTHVLMMLAFGYYPVDIARLRPEMVKIVEGDRYVVRIRERIAHICDIETWHWIPPELMARMERHKAHRHGTWFTNVRGNSLQTIGDTRTCNIGTNYGRACRKIGIDLPLKQMRKFGATWIANNVNEQVSRLYRASQLGGVDRLYIKDDFIAKLTPTLKSWHQKLVADGLYNVEPKIDGRSHA